MSREIWAGRRAGPGSEKTKTRGKAEFRDLGKRNEGGSGSGGSSRGAESVVFFSSGRCRQELRSRAVQRKRGSERWKGSRSRNHPNGVSDSSFIVIIMQDKSLHGLGPSCLNTLLAHDLLTIPLLVDATTCFVCRFGKETKTKRLEFADPLRFIDSFAPASALAPAEPVDLELKTPFFLADYFSFRASP